jgi:hypothetical protein
MRQRQIQFSARASTLSHVLVSVEEEDGVAVLGSEEIEMSAAIAMGIA